MLRDRRGADLVEWIVVIVLAVGVVGVSLYSVFQALSGSFDALSNIIKST
jgi:Flp pilus assembly pilin Flp